MRLGVDPKQADQIVRGSIVLPHGIGKSQRVVVFAKGDMAEAGQGRRRRRSRRRRTGQEDQGRLDRFRRLHRRPRHDGPGRSAGQGARSARPDAFAPRRHGHARSRPRRSSEYKAGKVEFRNDAGGIVHAVVGKLSFDAQKLVENIQAFIHHIQHLKPHAVKGST